MTFEQTSKAIQEEVKQLTKEVLAEKITLWSLNDELKIYVPILQKEYESRE